MCISTNIWTFQNGLYIVVVRLKPFIHMYIHTI